jgi:hypothetical protein
MATITPAGGSPVTLLFLKGDLQPLGAVLEDINRKGATGTAYRELGRIAPTCELEAWRDEDTQATAQAFFIATKAALEKKLCTIVDDSGITHSNVMVKAVERMGQPKQIAAAVGGISALAGALIKMRIVCQVAKA